MIVNKKHNTCTHVIQEFAHQPLLELAKTSFAVTPTVAHAAADAVIIAGRLLLDGLARVRWLIHDFGMTSEVAFNMRFDYYGPASKPGRNERCPCGSGRKFKRVSIGGGSSGTPRGAERTINVTNVLSCRIEGYWRE